MCTHTHTQILIYCCWCHCAVCMDGWCKTVVVVCLKGKIVECVNCGCRGCSGWCHFELVHTCVANISYNSHCCVVWSIVQHRWALQDVAELLDGFSVTATVTTGPLGIDFARCLITCYCVVSAVCTNGMKWLFPERKISKNYNNLKKNSLTAELESAHESSSTACWMMILTDRQ